MPHVSVITAFLWLGAGKEHTHFLNRLFVCLEISKCQIFVFAPFQ